MSGSVVAAAAILIAGCGGSGKGSSSSTSATAARTTAPAAPSTFRLTSAAFAAGAAIPPAYTCDGADRSPPLRWTGIPPGTRELVLVMRDPDAPGGNFVHWAVAGIRPATGGFQAGRVSASAISGRNSFATIGYRGPCPPPGSPHHYVITLRALGRSSGLAAGFSASQLRTSALGTATLIGTYGRR
jgi:Raf kinase inhibitor-like YbhB/YbcL family protein